MENKVHLCGYEYKYESVNDACVCGRDGEMKTMVEKIERNYMSHLFHLHKKELEK